MYDQKNEGGLFTGDCRLILPELATSGVKAQTCITSPPYYGLRDYGCAGQIGLEPTVNEYVENLVEVFRLVRDVLADDGEVLHDPLLPVPVRCSAGHRADRDLGATRG